jgi:hypothetical protein
MPMADQADQRSARAVGAGLCCGVIRLTGRVTTELPHLEFP